MVEENHPHIGDQTDASHISESRKKDSTLRVLFKFYKLLFTKWRNKKKNDESKTEHQRETNFEAGDGEPHPHNKVHIFVQVCICFYVLIDLVFLLRS